MEYIRKIRNANYNSKKCKLYLRHDFKHECAYCKISEYDISNIQAVAERFFEKDHFEPQNSERDNPIVHDYANLFYACEKCNGSKNDSQTEILNPCKDDIFGGDDQQIAGGDIANQYLYRSSTIKGKSYIDLFQLNSRYHIRIRKERYERKRREEEGRRRIARLELAGVDKNLIEEMRLCFEPVGVSKSEDLLGNTEVGCYFAEFEEEIKRLGIEYTFLLEEYNLDIRIRKADTSYDCEIIIDDTENDNGGIYKFLDIGTIKHWNRSERNYGIIYFCPKIHRSYFYQINSENINFDKKKQKVYINEVLF